jgi:hypothetical protein
VGPPGNFEIKSTESQKFEARTCFQFLLQLRA